jgi:hypothetical protein
MTPAKSFLDERANYTKSKWFQLYCHAVLELEYALMAGHIMAARSEILRRLEALENIPGLHESERQCIQCAFSTLRTLEREEIRAAGEKQTEVAKLALVKLRSVGPMIERL